MTPTDWAAFLGIAFVVIATPGPDTALTVRNSLRGRRAGTFTAFGVVTGQLVWTLAASTGVAALLVASEPAFRALKMAGALYLIYLGVMALAGAWRGHRNASAPTPDRPLPAASAYRQGLVSNLGNPKAAVFFTSLLPQFMSPGATPFARMILLGTVFASITLVWLCGYAFVVDKAGDFFRRSRVRRWLDALTAIVLIAFGIRMAGASDR
jgi:threonine/homoserine/homoserine lactone efflux protein